MSRENNEAGMVGLVIGVIIGAIISLALVTGNNRDWKNEAVRLGHAEWTIDSQGIASWQWIEHCVSPEISIEEN